MQCQTSWTVLQEMVPVEKQMLAQQNVLTYSLGRSWESKGSRPPWWAGKDPNFLEDTVTTLTILEDTQTAMINYWQHVHMNVPLQPVLTEVNEQNQASTNIRNFVSMLMHGPDITMMLICCCFNLVSISTLESVLCKILLILHDLLT